MNKLISGMLGSAVIGAALVLTACFASPSEVPGSTPAAVEVDEGLLTVDVRLSRSVLDPGGTLTDEAIISAAEDKGFSAVIDGDTVIYTMNKLQHEQMLADLRDATEQSVDDLIADESNSVTGVEFDSAHTSFRVSVDAARYSQFESLLVLGFYVSGALYQQFDGVAPDDVDVIVEIVDDATGEVLTTGSYQDMRANLEQ